MTSLEVLDLSHNELTQSPKGHLGPLPNLTHINLSNNLLLDIPVDELIRSLRLSLVDLENNRLTRFYDEFIPLMENNGTKVMMAGNPIVCDCRLRPLQFWLSGQNSSSPWDQVRCSGPPILAGQFLTAVDSQSLNCGRDDELIDRTKYTIVTDVLFRHVSG